MIKKLVLGVTCALLCTSLYWVSASGLLYALLGGDPLLSLDIKAQDAILQHPRIPNPDIYVIGVDADTLREIGPWHTWDRGIMAKLIETLNADPASAPAVIGVDVSYFNTTDPIYDAQLAEAAKKGGNVVMACEAVFEDVLMTDEKGTPYLEKMQVTQIDYPFEALRAGTTQGMVNTLPEHDGVIRNGFIRVSKGTETVNSFALEIANRYTEKKGLPAVSLPRTDALNRFPIAFSGVSGDYYTGNSFVRVLNGDIPPQAFAGSIVLIGPYAAGMMDQYYSPLESGRMMYGVEIHANIVQALLEQNYKNPVPVPLQAIFLFLLVLACYLTFAKADPRLSTLLAVCISLFYLLAATRLYRIGWTIHMIYLPLLVTLLYLYRMIYSYFAERMNRQLVTDTFKRYMEPSVVEHLLKSPEARSSMNGSKRDIAVMFVDIRGFTTMSESLDTADVVSILNEYLSAASAAIFENQGTLDKFIGDAAMAIFNAPLDLPDYTYCAVKTAIDLAAQGNAMSDRLQQRFGKSVSFGIGVHCGEAIVGNIGAEFRRDYTAIGDTVNTAARLEGRAKAGQILISESVYKRLEGRIIATCIGPIELKGKQNHITVYAVDGLLPEKENL